MNGCVYRTADNQCEKFSDPFRNTLSWCVGDTACEARKLSNADRIRAMTDEELAEKWWKLLDCGVCPARPNCSLHHEDCIQFTLAWLKKEVEK